jgi:plastocyanin
MKTLATQAGRRRTDRRRRLVHPAILSLLAIAILAGCGTSGRDRPAVETSAVTSGGVQVARISLHSFYYEPNRVVVKVGIPVELKLEKKSLFVPHNFSLYAPEAGIQVNRNVGTLGFLPGGATVRFTPTKPGEYEFSCGKHNHAAKGMRGTLIVRP